MARKSSKNHTRNRGKRLQLRIMTECPTCILLLRSGQQYDPASVPGATGFRNAEWRLPCGHLFHTVCLMRQVTLLGDGCPMCSVPFLRERPRPDPFGPIDALPRWRRPVLLTLALLFFAFGFAMFGYSLAEGACTVAYDLTRPLRVMVPCTTQHSWGLQLEDSVLDAYPQPIELAPPKNSTHILPRNWGIITLNSQPLLLAPNECAIQLKMYFV